MVCVSFTPKEKFQLMAIIDYRLQIPTLRDHLKICNNYQLNNSSVSNSGQLHLNGHNIPLNKATVQPKNNARARSGARSSCAARTRKRRKES